MCLCACAYTFIVCVCVCVSIVCASACTCVHVRVCAWARVCLIAMYVHCNSFILSDDLCSQKVRVCVSISINVVTTNNEENMPGCDGVSLRRSYFWSNDHAFVAKVPIICDRMACSWVVFEQYYDITESWQRTMGTRS